MIIKQFIGFVLLIIFTRYVISYTNFEFEIPFFIRTKPGIELADGLMNNGNGDSSELTVQTTEDINNLHKIVNPDDLIENAENDGNTDDSDLNSDTQTTEAATEEASGSMFSSLDELKAQGFYLSDGIYEKPELRSAQKYEYAFAKIVPEHDMPKSRIVSAAGGNFNAIEPVMDFLLIRSADNLILCDNAGKILAENLEFQIVKGRDESNSSVLSNTRYETDGDQATEVRLYFVYDKNMKSFIQSSYTPIYGDRGVPFMYPSYYGANGASSLSRYESDGKWGYYAHGTDIPAISPEYDMAYNFSENIGVAYKSEQRGNWRAGYYNVRTLHFLDEQGIVLNSDYYAPDEITANHLGFFYFENGLTRAYRREFDNQGRITVEKDVLVDKNGIEFYIPEDYTIKAYSNGAILLEKDNFYGFMNYNGDWIAQPIFTYAQPFYEGVAVIGFANGKKALIDTDGNLIVKFQYDYISNCSGGSIALYEANQGWTVLGKMRKDK